jgi:TRAP-type C4-dicarboxylate transport system substrate-binding protein
MKKAYKIFLVLLILLAISSLLIGSQLMAAEKKTVLKFAHVLQLDHPYHAMALKFKEELESRNANVEVNIFPAKQLGSERDLVEACQLGTVDITTITSAVTANFVPGFHIFSLPFLFKDPEHLFRTMDSYIGDKLAIDMVEAGFIKLGYVYGGARDLYSREPIRNLEDLKGKKIRTMQNAILRTGMSYRSMKFYDSSPHYTKVNYVSSWHCFMMSKKTWDRLDNGTRLDIMAAAKIAGAFERKLFVDMEKSLFDDLEKNYGVTIYYPDLDKWTEKIKSVYEKNAEKKMRKKWAG